MKNGFGYGKIALALLLSCFLVLSCIKRQPAVKIEYAKTAAAITLKGKTVNIYSTNYGKAIDRSDGIEIARRLTELSSKKWSFAEIQTREKTMLALKGEKDPSAAFEMDLRSGNFLYNAGLADYKSDGDTPGLVPEGKAEQMALRHIEKLGLSPSRKEMKALKVGGLGMAIVTEDNRTETYDKLVTVRFERELAGVPVMGESRIVVHLGENGALAGMIYYWADISSQRGGSGQELLPDKAIVRELEDRLRAAAPEAGRIVVDKSDFVLYDDGQGMIEPAFHVQARLYYESPAGEKGEKARKYDVPYDFYVPVLKSPAAFFPFMGKAEIMPTDGRKVELVPEDDE